MPGVARIIIPILFSFRPISTKHIIERQLFGIRRSIAITI
jgi:hypothetical protein